jgi:pimeloyl-ACP methyl ester carboxylesterase
MTPTTGLTCLMAMGIAATAAVSGSPRHDGTQTIEKVVSTDGTLIAVECAGSGPNLLIVHGGTGDRTRWTPLFPLFATQFRVCAMDRRAHGDSGDAAEFSLQKEVEDVSAVVKSRSGPVFVLGHSYGGVCAFEAAFLTDKIPRLVLYEPPLRNPDNSAIHARMARMIQEGDRDRATVTFLRQIVMISDVEVAAMKDRPSWARLVATIDASIRQDRALGAYRFNRSRAATLKIPMLLLTGSDTESPQLKLAIQELMDVLPDRRLFTFAGQQHNAMDSVPQQFADVVAAFLLAAQPR